MKALLPILVTLSGMEIEVRFWQFLNVLAKILVMPAGSVTEARALNSPSHSKAPRPIELMLPGSVIETREVRLKAHLPMEVTLSGRAIETRDQQLKKAWSPMEVTPPGTTTRPCVSGVYRQPPAGQTRI